MPQGEVIQISREINPMNWQHLSSIERTGSIDSACYDFGENIHASLINQSQVVH